MLKMTTIIRLKRSLEDSPQETLILNCNKKRKCEEPPKDDHETQPLLSVLKFRGTQHSLEEDITEHVKSNPSKDKLSLDWKKHKVDIHKRLRHEAQQNSKNSRYKVLNCLRSDLPLNDESLTIYDIELEGNEKDELNDSQKFVYDLYYTETAEEIDDADNYNISVYPTSESLVFDSDDVYNIDDENDSEDSNAENNWRNDYPDESDADSIDENDMIAAMNKCDLNDDTLSTEDEDECSYGPEEYDHECDDEFGKRYAQFKSKYEDSDIESD